ncbi:Sugar fermentation stimulation protein-like [Porphyridium purpureum]|uniref:Sugar fermentation stimulation protein-like n=1 Tax=Porphyridium purpureum TaxID=35688 RepID=A0A5J4YRR6_PORPP|nr:Sugar fermentation stimulation protein-like [Porphyridium purpureum]|eukprot:POR8571..scf236_6
MVLTRRAAQKGAAFVGGSALARAGHGRAESLAKSGVKRSANARGLVQGHRRKIQVVAGVEVVKAGELQDAVDAVEKKAVPVAGRWRIFSGELEPAVFVQRPSARNRSPYVADVRLESGRIAIAHVPCLELGGKCVPGARVLVAPMLDKKNNRVGADAVSNKFGTPKCEFSVKFVYYTDDVNAAAGGTLVGADPQFGEKVARLVVEETTLFGSDIVEIQTQVPDIMGPGTRCDFVLTHKDNSRTVLETKMVVDADNDPAGRCAVFPWGKRAQKGPDGEKVVSARAIHHVQCLTRLMERRKESGSGVRAALMLAVVRDDTVRFRPDAEKCPSFAKYLTAGVQAGVDVRAFAVRCHEDGTVTALGEIPLQV